jgi:hypothetical protein
MRNRWNFRKVSTMIIIKHRIAILLILLISLPALVGAQNDRRSLESVFKNPPPNAAPWVFWYWMEASVSKEGITADLQAMKDAGIGGAYLMPIKGPTTPPLMDSVVVQLTPKWWEMIRYTFLEAKRIGIKLGLHVSDGFALAGGPWITPELSMQKVVWTQINSKGGTRIQLKLKQPETLENYYKDIAVFAYPSPVGTGLSTATVVPRVTSGSTDSSLQYLVDPLNKRSFSCDDQCWIQYKFDQPFTCRSIIIHSRNNYQANRLIIQVSDDGKNFRSVERLDPPRHGWQDWDADYTHAIPATTARFFRFVYDKSGTEPGSEDLDAAKWKPSFKITGIELSSEAKIDEYEGKNGEVWRISKYSSDQQVPFSSCIPLKSIVNLTNKVDKSGNLNWTAPQGNWTIIRMGHTSTGHQNETAGGGKGLECDKFNPAAITLQFNSWYGEHIKQLGPELANSVLKCFHVDSWECGSQNWSPVFRSEFQKRRGYDPVPYLPIMAGIPIESADVSERFLHDVRQTIAELINDKFYHTLAMLAHQHGVEFSGESVAPTMVSDGMLHYKTVDRPMGEFWLRSPTHDKPNDMLDAISGGHIYGKNIIQAEAFTELRQSWDEHPGILKTLADRSFALGINRLFYHVFMHNPWVDRRPGMTLDAIGLYFQRDQTWWKQAKAWVDYAKRCQALLQMGKPVVDIAVFTGEEIPRRSVLPDRLVPVLPGIFGKSRVVEEQERLANKGQPLRQLPAGVTSSANMADKEDWTDPLHGYAYDSYNVDALQHLSSVKNGQLQLATGAGYKLLVFPGETKMSPYPGLISATSATILTELVKKGATVVINEPFTHSAGLLNYQITNKQVRNTNQQLLGSEYGSNGMIRTFGKGRVLYGPYTGSTFSAIGLEPDFIAKDVNGIRADKIAWTHRRGSSFDIYFVSNQKDSERVVTLSLRVNGKVPELWDPVSGDILNAKNWRVNNHRTELPVHLNSNGSLFIVLRKSTSTNRLNDGNNWVQSKVIESIDGPWTVLFDPANGGPKQPVLFDHLTDWSKHQDSAIRYYSGTAQYNTSITYHKPTLNKKLLLNIGKVNNLADVYVNGKFIQTLWTAPFRVDITNAIREGENNIRIDVTNTWANRLIGDQHLPTTKRITYTMYPFKMEGRPLLPAGLIGPVKLEQTIE